MVTTRSKSKPAATVAAAPEPPTTPTTPISSPGTPETPVTPPKRKRSRTCRDSPIPYKIRKTQHTPQGSPRSQTLDVLSDSDHEEVQISGDEDQEEPVPAIKSFGQDTFVKNWSDIGRHNSLEFFQAYPHDHDSTLCVRHFLRLADGWYIRRRPMVQAQLHSMLKDGVSSKPDFSDLSLPICEDTWTIPSLQTFREKLSGEIKNAQHRLQKHYNRVLFATLLAPACELGNEDQELKCAMCPDGKPDGKPDSESDEESTIISTDKRIYRGHHTPEELDRVLHDFKTDLRERRVSSILKCGHESPIMILGGEKGDVVECEDCPHTQPANKSCWVPYKYALRVAGVQIPVEVAPARMALNSKLGHVSVGGLHFIVDDCLHGPLIKFRSTRFSQAHEMEGFDYHDEGDLKTVRFALPFGAAEDNHEYDYDEEFDQYRVGIANLESLYWRSGAFEPTGCSDLFENCSCH
ncbi:hypothetical protein FSARC_9306 [Fusarium sarcochroum]|uniref:Uncharacterized protein n=1 Tax=Fusarium sarcochroum TaxID=1208366 RepID=A0A8H4TR89_9HYPO|nr:hypothetical protein FSARC_9306 [Fusarium sarcochroum]